MIRLTSLMETVELLPSGNLRITDINDISPSQWERISRIMDQKGYESRGGDDAKRAITKFLTNPNNEAPDVINHDIYDKWVDTIAMVMKVEGKRDSASKGYDPRSIIRGAVRTFGLTDNMSAAGYILPNGGLLSLSHGGGVRDRDHRDISSVYIKLGVDAPGDTRSSATAFMNDFMKICRAIRIGGSQNFLDMWNEPTRQQAVQLLKYFEMYEGDIILVVKSEKYGSAEQQYKKGTSPGKIIQDIVTFYRTGIFPEKLFENVMLDELKKVDLSDGGNDMKYVVVFRSQIFILDDSSDLAPVRTALKDHPGTKYARSSESLNDLMINVAEAAPDILVGEWYPDKNGLVVWNQKEIIPQTSLQAKKAAKRLGIKTVTYRYNDYMGSGDTVDKDISVKKLKGEIPKVMFHGTSTTELKSILKYGLDPDRGPSRFSKQGIVHPDHVFVAATLEAAQYYAAHAVEVEKKSWDNFPIVIEVKIPDPNLLAPDFDADVSTDPEHSPYYLGRTDPPPDVTVMKAMGVSLEMGKWGYKGRIPAAFIKWVYYYNAYQKKWHRSRPEVFERLLMNHDWETLAWRLGMQGYKEDQPKYGQYWQ